MVIVGEGGGDDRPGMETVGAAGDGARASSSSPATGAVTWGGGR